MRTSVVFTALALAFAFGTATAEEPEPIKVGAIEIRKDAPLPGITLVDGEGLHTYLTEVVTKNKATVVKFFDPERDPVYLHVEGEAMSGAETPFTRLYLKFKKKDVRWIFVAVGEPDSVMVLHETWLKESDPEVKANLAKQLKSARTAYFAGMEAQLKERGIETYTLYAAPVRMNTPESPAPACAIVRGELVVSHVATAGDEQAITNLISELHLAVNDPSASGALPASTPR